MGALGALARAVERTANTVVSELKTIVSGRKNVDCVFIVAPGTGEAASRHRRMAQAAGLSYAFIGDGEGAVTREMINAARQSGVLGDDTEVFFDGHGVLEDQSALLELDSEEPISPSDLIEWIRSPLEEGNTMGIAQKPWTGNIHLMACHVGKFRDEFAPGINGERGLWEQGHVFLHGSGNPLYTEAGMEDFETVMREIAVTKRITGHRPDSMQITKALVERQADSITLMGGNLEAPLRLHSPKSLRELFFGDLNSRLREEDAHGRLAAYTKRITGPEDARNQLLSATSLSASGPIKAKHATNLIFSRINHLSTSAKIARLTDDLRDFPGLLKLSDRHGLTPLMFAASIPRHSGVAKHRYELIKQMAARGADINARDKKGRSAVHYAALAGDQNMLRVLISLGANMKATDRDGNSVFHYLTLAPRREAIKVLEYFSQQKLGQDIVNVKNKKGMTALHLGVEDLRSKGSDQMALLHALQRAGADPSIRDKKGVTPGQIINAFRQN